MHKFFTPLIEENCAIIEGDDHKHLSRVLRIREGEEVLINDLRGMDFRGKVLEIGKTRTVVELLERSLASTESPVEVTLYQGIPKAGKMDLIVQKCTELGVTRIVPVKTQRVVVNSTEFKKMDRLNRIALEAAKQSKRSRIPVIEEPMSFEQMLEEIPHLDLFLVPYENAEEFGFHRLVLDQPKAASCGILIGPEGGFEEAEIEELRRRGARIITLGQRILRTETAGFTALTLVQTFYGDMGGSI